MDVKSPANAGQGPSAVRYARIRQGARLLAVARVRERRGEIERSIWEGVNDQRFDLSGSEDAEYVAGLRAAAVAALEYVLSGVERAGESRLGQEPAEPAPAAVLEQARRAARMGVKQETVLRRYVAGQALLGRFLAKEVAREKRLAGSAVLSEVLDAVAKVVDVLIADVSQAYEDELERIAARRQAVAENVAAASVGRAGVGRASVERASVKRGSVERASVERASMERAKGRAVRAGFGSPEAMRRGRILGAIVEVVAERGYAGAKLGPVIERAKVSRGTFYELFPGGLDEGLIAVLDETMAQGKALVAEQFERFERREVWLEGMRAATAALLLFLDEHIEVARVCFVDTLGASRNVVEHRERLVGEFGAQVVAYIEGAGVRVSPVNAESVLTSLMGMVRTRLVATREPQSSSASLIELLGPLAEIIATPTAASEQTVREERRRGDELARAIQAGEIEWTPAAGVAAGAGEADAAGEEDAVPGMLANPNAHRLRECLDFMAENPEASNREVAAGIGVTHSSQISKLLSELAQAGLAVRRSQGAGKRNAWRLTERGERAARAMRGRSFAGEFAGDGDGDKHGPAAADGGEPSTS